MAVFDFRWTMLYNCKAIKLSKDSLQLLEDWHEGGHEEDLLLAANDTN